MSSESNRYQALIEKVFFSHYKKGLVEFEFEREEMEAAAIELGFPSVKNLGDVAYSFRYRNQLPGRIVSTQPAGKEWIIEGAGRGRYRFKLAPKTRIEPQPEMAVVEIPDATPELIRMYALADEQALLATIRYNRLIDTFLGLTCYSPQNHLRTSVKDLGQIEIDELYVGLDKRGCHYIIPVQAKGSKDQIGVVQVNQDMRFVEEKFPEMQCRAIAAKFMDNEAIALFELGLQGGEVKIVAERHYRLVPHDGLDQGAIRAYRD